VTEKLQAYQKQLGSLAFQVTVAEDRERRQLAEELHDQIGQLLAVSKIKLAGRALEGQIWLHAIQEVHVFNTFFET
jgi:signal transduction histidine kinase